MKTSATASQSTFDFRTLLNDRFDAAKKRNRRFSVRGYARQLNIDHATLSQILRGKRPLTKRMIRSLSLQLGLPEHLAESYTEREKLSKLTRSKRSFNQLELDRFYVISDWHHYAILELTHLSDFLADSRWIARVLGLSVSEVNIAIQRLLRLDLLEMVTSKKWVDKSRNIEFKNVSSSETLRRRLHTQTHELALQCLGRVPIESSEYSSATVSVNSQSLAKIRALMESFMQDIQTVLSEESNADDVYQIAISALPLTTLKIKKGEKNE